MSSRFKNILKDNFCDEDVLVTAGWIAVILTAIFIIPEVFKSENERFRYLGEFISQEKNVTIVDSVTHEYHDYEIYIRYRNDEGVECGMSPNCDCDDAYRIKTDRNSGKKYVYEMASFMCRIVYIVLLVLIAFLCLLIFCIGYEDGGRVRDFLRSCKNTISDLLPEKPEPEITNKKEHNDGPPHIIV